jgi:hypothetical protein
MQRLSILPPGRMGRPHAEVLGAASSGAGAWTGAGTTWIGSSSARTGVGFDGARVPAKRVNASSHAGPSAVDSAAASRDA